MHNPQNKVTFRKLPGATVRIYGRYGEVGTQIPKITSMAKQLGAKQVHIMRPPASPDGPGARCITSSFEPAGNLNYAEGGILKEPGQAIMIPTRDCHTVVLHNRMNGWVGAAHAGRESLIARDTFVEHMTVVHQLLSKLEVLNSADLTAYISTGICSEHFPHQEAWYVEPFAKLYGDHVIPDKERKTLDVCSVIKEILHRWGVTKKQIFEDKLCPVETPWLGSLRAGKEGQNWVFVVKH